MQKQLYGDTVKITLSEGLTANNIPKFNEDLSAMMPGSEEYKDFILDLANIDNIDSVGVTFVIGLFKKIKAQQKKFMVAGASEDIKNLFKLMKLDQFFEMIE